MLDTNKKATDHSRDNAMRHGLRSGRLPPKCKYIEHSTNRLRRELESAVRNLKGRIDISDSASINSAVKWETHGMLCRRWLRLEGDKLSISERIKLSESLAKASDNRDRAIRLLGLDRDSDNVIEALYKRLPAITTNGNTDGPTEPTE